MVVCRTIETFSMSNPTPKSAGTFSLAIDNNKPVDFQHVSAFEESDHTRITGEREEWEQQVKRMEFHLAKSITSGRYDLNSPEVKFVEAVSDWVNTKYLVKSLTLDINADHTNRHIVGQYQFKADEIDSQGSGIGITGNGDFNIHYS